MDVRVQEIAYTEDHRLLTPDKELNRVLGGGIVGGSLVLIGGEPGIICPSRVSRRGPCAFADYLDLEE